MDTSRAAVIEAVPTRKAPSSKRQHRSPELKRKIVEETLTSGSSVARVARAHGVNANQVFQWRRLYLAGRLGSPPLNMSRLLPVSVSEQPAKDVVESPAAEAVLAPSSGREASGPGAIHLELRKARLRIEGHADPAVLRLVLKALLG